MKFKKKHSQFRAIGTFEAYFSQSSLKLWMIFIFKVARLLISPILKLETIILYTQWDIETYKHNTTIPIKAIVITHYWLTGGKSNQYCLLSGYREWVAKVSKSVRPIIVYIMQIIWSDTVKQLLASVRPSTWLERLFCHLKGETPD